MSMQVLESWNYLQEQQTCNITAINQQLITGLKPMPASKLGLKSHLKQ